MTASGRLLDVQGQPLLVPPQGVLRPLALDRPGDLGGNELEHAQLGRAVGLGVLVVLDDHGPDRQAVHDQGDAEPDGRGRADEVDLAAAPQVPVRGLVAKQGPARPDDVFGQALAGLYGVGGRVLLVHEVGEVDEVLVPVEQGDVEIPGRHDRADDLVDRPVEVIEARRFVGGLRDPVDGVLEELGLLPVGDVLHHADHPATSTFRIAGEEAAVVDPAVAPVSVAEPVVDLVGPVLPFGHLEEPDGFAPVLGMDPLGPFRDPAHFLEAVAQNLFQAAAPGDPARVRIVVVDDLA